MSEDALRALAAKLAEEVCRSYKLGPDEAAERILAVWLADRAFCAALAAAPDAEKFTRTRVYKDAATRARKAIYFSLRRYRADDGALAAACEKLAALPKDGDAAPLLNTIACNHASTAERADHLETFWNEIFPVLGAARSLIDVGSGVLPVLFPFARAPSLERYLACDRDGAAIRAVEAYAAWRGDGRLVARQWDLKDGWIAGQGFDVALMLKIVPVVKRQEPALLDILARVPARRVILTGSKEALVKRRAIARREKNVIESFAQQAGFRILARFETPDEIGLVAETGA